MNVLVNTWNIIIPNAHSWNIYQFIPREVSGGHYSKIRTFWQMKMNDNIVASHKLYLNKHDLQI